jgi:hypothetical protein
VVPKLTTWSGAELVIVTAVPVLDKDIPVLALRPLVASDGPVPSFTNVSVPPADVSVTPDAGLELVIVKLGYVPVTPIPVPAVRITV